MHHLCFKGTIFFFVVGFGVFWVVFFIFQGMQETIKRRRRKQQHCQGCQGSIFFFCIVSINYAAPFINPLAPVNYSTILASSWKATSKH